MGAKEREQLYRHAAAIGSASHAHERIARNRERGRHGLDQACKEPGHWLIEGFDVMRAGPQRYAGWVIYGYSREDVRAVVNTLAEARAWIREYINS